MNRNEIPPLAAKLSEAIKAKGCTQADVAREFGVRPSTVSSDWLKHGRIAKRHYPRLVSFFGKSYEWWFGHGPSSSASAGDDHAQDALSIGSNATAGVPSSSATTVADNAFAMKLSRDERAVIEVLRQLPVGIAVWMTEFLRRVRSGDTPTDPSEIRPDSSPLPKSSTKRKKDAANAEPITNGGGHRNRRNTSRTR